METMVRGSRKPDLEMVLDDEAGTANWALLTTSNVKVRAEMNGMLLFDEPATAITVGAGNSNATVRYSWAAADVDTVGRMWIEVVVTWSAGNTQTFPHDGPMRLDIVRAAGDA